MNAPFVAKLSSLCALATSANGPFGLLGHGTPTLPPGHANTWEAATTHSISEVAL